METVVDLCTPLIHSLIQIQMIFASAVEKATTEKGVRSNRIGFEDENV
jgi:hypothetical protein